MIHILTILLFLISANLTFSQTEKKSLDISIYESWNRLANYNISNNGEWVFYEVNPGKGDGNLFITNPNSSNTKEINRGYNASFSSNSDFVIYKIKPEADTLREQKLAKVKKDKLLKDSLGIWVFSTDTIILVPKVKSYKKPKEDSNWLAYTLEKSTKKKKATPTEKKKKLSKKAKAKLTAENKAQKKINAKLKKQKGSKLVIFNPITYKKYEYKNVAEFTFSKNGKLLNFIVNITDSVDTAYVYSFNTITEKLTQIINKPGVAKNIIIDNKGKYSSFAFSSDTGDVKLYSLNLYNLDNNKLTIIVDTNSAFLPNKWTVSTNYSINYSEDSKHLFYGIAPNPVKEPKDTLLKEEKCNVDVWHWNDSRIQPQQLKAVKRDKKKTYLSVYNLENNKAVQLANDSIKTVATHSKGNGKYALGIISEKYQKSTTWEFPSSRDYYLINIKTGEKTIIFSDVKYFLRISPNDKYIYWFNGKEKAWFSKDIEQNKIVNLSSEINVNFYDEENDIPRDAGSYGISGWTDNDKYILINDRYDIWKIDPTKQEKPVNITNTRQKLVKNTYKKLDFDLTTININNDILVKTFDDINKSEGYKLININTLQIKELINQDFAFNTPRKAKNAEKIVWVKASFNKYPDLNYSNLDYTKIKKLSDINPQQKDYLWGTVEQVKWKSYKNEELNGLLYKPENFNPNKKYPMIVYFYEKYSDRLHAHHVPKPSHSTVNFTYFASNGYLVFVPDINYTTGSPGQDAYDAIVSGTEFLKKNSWVNSDKIGIQGQSWGGYQVAYLVTKTNIYSAAMAGAPVSNMTSAYGGVRWKSGMSRMFQYEQGQSRLGKTLWEDRDRYIQNSPIFFADKINTPLMIMHNDNDGAVPWYQGIEYYMALRRLEKPVWLINYNNAPHNLRRWPDRVDLSIRMHQFFDYYLKDAKIPEWMNEGIPAIEKGKNFGYDLVK